MDMTPVISQITSVFWFLIPILIVVTVLKTPWFKGIFGELVVRVSTKFMLRGEDYYVMHDVTLPTENGTTQIDHIVISIYGVFVIETKNMKGWIFGSANQSTWTQQIYKHKTKFQNPLRQNYKHIKTLESLLDINDNQLFSVVAFVGSSTFKTEMPDNVTTGLGFIRYIKSRKNILLTENDFWRIVIQVTNAKIDQSLKTNREHVRHVKSAVAEKNAGRSCPKCGAQMVMREAKRGPNAGNNFWGCTNYPRCRGTVNTTRQTHQ